MSSPEPSSTPPEPEENEPLPAAWTIGKSPWTRFRERARGNWPLQIGLGLLSGYLLVGVAALVRYGSSLQSLPSVQAFVSPLHPPGPSWTHPFGVMTGPGVDILSALVRATPIDLALIGGPVLLALAIGLLLGAIAGFVGGPLDLAVTFGSDLLTTAPPFFLVMVLFLGLQPYLKASQFLPVFGLLFALVLWPYHARPVRARAAQIAGETYVEAARAAGSGTGRLLRRHVIPNSIYPLLAQIPVDVYNLMFVLTVFPFLNLLSGSLFAPLSPLPASTYPEWGFLLANGVASGWSPLQQIDYWWMYAFPAATVVLFGIAVALVCDGLERLLAGGRPVR